MRLLPEPAPRRRPLPSLRYAHRKGPPAYAPVVASTILFCDVRGYTALAEECPAPVDGTVVRWGRREERTVVGDAANVAKRLESQAGPGEVLVAGSTILGAGGMQTERLGERFLKGRRAPVDVHRIVRTGSVTERVPDAHRSRVVVAPLP